MQGSLQPFACAHLALVTEAVRIAPPSALHQQLHGGLDLPLVRIALLNHRYWNAVRAENNLRLFGRREAAQDLFDFLHDRVEIHRVPIESLDIIDSYIAVEQPPPLVQT